MEQAIITIASSAGGGAAIIGLVLYLLVKRMKHREDHKLELERLRADSEEGLYHRLRADVERSHDALGRQREYIQVLEARLRQCSLCDDCRERTDLPPAQAPPGEGVDDCDSCDGV